MTDYEGSYSHKRDTIEKMFDQAGIRLSTFELKMFQDDAYLLSLEAPQKGIYDHPFLAPMWSLSVLVTWDEALVHVRKFIEAIQRSSEYE